MIYITGDIHGVLEVGTRFNINQFPEQAQLTKKDYVIVAGDFGLPWNNDEEDLYWLEWINKKPFTTLFVDGNHENFDLLRQFPTEKWAGGIIHRVREHVFHLNRGHVFQLDGVSFFTMGGANSYDRAKRVEHFDWWKEEMPSYREYERALDVLDQHDWKVDYVVTHTCSSNAIDWLSQKYNFYVKQHDQLNVFLQSIEDNLQYKMWYFGHFHHDAELPHSQTLIYDKIIKIV